jgi:hypothetical protein
MTPPRIAGIVLLVVGVLLLIFGINASDSAGEQIREGLTGRFSDKTMWYIVGGAALGVLGLVLTVMGAKKGG